MSYPVRSHQSAGSPALIGREHELSTLAAILDRNGPAVAHVHGVPGIGKSALLRAFLAHAHSKGHAAHLLDCRAIEPTESALERELLALAAPVSVAGDAVSVLCLDNYDQFLLLDSWIRTHLLKRIAGRLRLVLCRRAQPNPAWLSVGGVFLGIKLRELDEDSSRNLLRAEGVVPEDQPALLRFAKGHPLALQLACAAVRNHRGQSLQDVVLHDVVGQLTGFFLQGIGDPAMRRAVEAASAVRRVTSPLLGELLEEEQPQPMYDRLAELPIFERRMDGLVLHAAVHEAVAKHLQSADPARFLSYKRIAWRALERQSDRVGAGDLWRYTADAIHLVDNPVVRGAFFPEGSQRLAVEDAVAADRQSVFDIVARYGGAGDFESLQRYWEFAPETFRVVREAGGQVAGFYCLFDPCAVPDRVLAADAMAAAWLSDLEPGTRGARGATLFLRRWLAAAAGEVPSAVQAACWLDVKRSYLALRPRLRRVYLALADLTPYAAVARELGFVGACAGQGLPLASAVLDFGPGSVDGWLRRLVRHELGILDQIVLDAARRIVLIGSDRIELTPLELGVMQALLDAGGEVVSRKRLLDLAWGERQEGVGSNVVDVVILSLRRKLDRHSGSIQTVRGSGYILRN